MVYVEVDVLDLWRLNELFWCLEQVVRWLKRLVEDLKELIR